MGFSRTAVGFKNPMTTTNDYSKFRSERHGSVTHDCAESTQFATEAGFEAEELEINY